MTAQEIRKSFIDFFEQRGHKIVPSAPMVVKDDPTLMFTNAGMNQFKDIILGNTPAKHKRVTDSQKCLRVSGKHNDLEEVGHDTYHHTMFEMLGNWSFGDYFKREAIDWAWEYLVGVLKLDPNRLYATVFEGSPAENLERDDEAAGYWAQYLPEKRIINGNKKDNFWEMGDTGPCGPCSEIHIDIRPDEEREKVDGLALVNQSHPQVIEIWNLVFMQYNRKADGSLEPLPARVIDTGMGFERLCMALQGKQSNYDTDVFQPLILAIGSLSATRYGESEKKDIAMRVIADHVRTIAFSIADGQLPSNAKAGYVIRRILRRAVRYGYTFLDQKQAFMYRLLPVLIESMGEVYSELISQRDLISKVMKEEEEAFLRTLETGICLLDNIIATTRAENNTEINGKDAFTLYDTYGFPLDLTELILREQGMTANIADFNKEMQQQKERARNAAAVETGDWIIIEEGDTEFVGYDDTECETRILRYRPVTQKDKTFYQIVLSVTPFYAESGGQVGDSGVLTTEGETISIITTKKENNLSVHLATTKPINANAAYKANVDTRKRTKAEANHSATHLLDQALREVLGTHIEQKGSLVSSDGLRFDFSHYQKVTDEELRRTEQIVNARIREDIPLCDHRCVPIEEAKGMGAIALFGEKYGDEVRVVQFGNSIEFCGGTHASSTGRIGLFRITSEGSVAAGIRRIEAVTGEQAEMLANQDRDTLSELKTLLGNAKDPAAAVGKLNVEIAALRSQIEVVQRERAEALSATLLNSVETVGDVKLVQYSGTLSAATAKDLAFKIVNKLGEEAAFVAGTQEDGKPMLTVMLGKGLTAKGLNAGNLVREAAKHIHGGGGGAPHFATAGGKDTSGLQAAVAAIVSAIK